MVFVRYFLLLPEPELLLLELELEEDDEDEDEEPRAPKMPLDDLPELEQLACTGVTPTCIVA